MGIALLAELNGASRYVSILQLYSTTLLIPQSSYINYALGALFALRISHAEFGILLPGAAGVGRPIGYFGTQAVLAGLAGYAAYLIKDFWLI